MAYGRRKQQAGRVRAPAPPQRPSLLDATHPPVVEPALDEGEACPTLATALQLLGGDPTGDAPDDDSLQDAALAGLGGAAPFPFGITIADAFGRHGHHVRDATAAIGGPAADAAETLGAEAYVCDGQAAFARSPDLFTAAHEAAHLVQQAHGVSPGGGIGAAGDLYERHADEVAEAVVARRSAEPILDRMVGQADAKAGVGRSGSTRLRRRSLLQRAPAGGSGARAAARGVSPPRSRVPSKPPKKPFSPQMGHSARTDKGADAPPSTPGRDTFTDLAMYKTILQVDRDIQQLERVQQQYDVFHPMLTQSHQPLWVQDDAQAVWNVRLTMADVPKVLGPTWRTHFTPPATPSVPSPVAPPALGQIIRTVLTNATLRDRFGERHFEQVRPPAGLWIPMPFTHIQASTSVRWAHVREFGDAVQVGRVLGLQSEVDRTRLRARFQLGKLSAQDVKDIVALPTTQARFEAYLARSGDTALSTRYLDQRTDSASTTAGAASAFELAGGLRSKTHDPKHAKALDARRDRAVSALVKLADGELAGIPEPAAFRDVFARVSDFRARHHSKGNAAVLDKLLGRILNAMSVTLPSQFSAADRRPAPEQLTAWYEIRTTAHVATTSPHARTNPPAVRVLQQLKTAVDARFDPAFAAEVKRASSTGMSPTRLQTLWRMNQGMRQQASKEEQAWFAKHAVPVPGPRARYGTIPRRVTDSRKAARHQWLASRARGFTTSGRALTKAFQTSVAPGATGDRKTLRAALSTSLDMDRAASRTAGTPSEATKGLTAAYLDKLLERSSGKAGKVDRAARAGAHTLAFEIRKLQKLRTLVALRKGATDTLDTRIARLRSRKSTFADQGKGTSSFGIRAQGFDNRSRRAFTPRLFAGRHADGGWRVLDTTDPSTMSTWGGRSCRTLEAALEDFQKRNDYPTSFTLRLEASPAGYNVGTRPGHIPAERLTVRGHGESTYKRWGRVLSIGGGLLVAAGMALAPFPGSRVASAVLVKSLVAGGIAAQVAGMSLSYGDDLSKGRDLDPTTIAMDVASLTADFLSLGTVRWIRLGALGMKITKGKSALMAIDATIGGGLLAISLGQLTSQATRILTDASLTSEQRKELFAAFLHQVALMGALFLIPKGIAAAAKAGASRHAMVGGPRQAQELVRSAAKEAGVSLGSDVVVRFDPSGECRFEVVRESGRKQGVIYVNEQASFKDLLEEVVHASRFSASKDKSAFTSRRVGTALRDGSDPRARKTWALNHVNEELAAKRKLHGDPKLRAMLSEVELRKLDADIRALQGMHAQLTKKGVTDAEVAEIARKLPAFLRSNTPSANPPLLAQELAQLNADKAAAAAMTQLDIDVGTDPTGASKVATLLWKMRTKGYTDEIRLLMELARNRQVEQLKVWVNQVWSNNDKGEGSAVNNAFTNVVLELHNIHDKARAIAGRPDSIIRLDDDLSTTHRSFDVIVQSKTTGLPSLLSDSFNAGTTTAGTDGGLATGVSHPGHKYVDRLQHLNTGIADATTRMLAAQKSSSRNAADAARTLQRRLTDLHARKTALEHATVEAYITTTIVPGKNHYKLAADGERTHIAKGNRGNVFREFLQALNSGTMVHEQHVNRVVLHGTIETGANPSVHASLHKVFVKRGTTWHMEP